ncbi:hypothetical protein INT47_000359 [Mucor saturninus]|uniref:Uncharacterized protein n=1 Tax=Mucor saturninus TaxID=64648 RepID=A0A8H7QWA8_9FUNG|nr:hypothetical protein INT47_000359 [Mucor saturninus]
MQTETGLYNGLELKHSDQRVICTMDYQGTYSVDLKLVSAQYPAFRLAQRKLVPQLLRQAHFVIPFGLKELRLSSIACVEKHRYTKLSSESIDDMLEKLSQEYNGFKHFGFSSVDCWSKRYFRELRESYPPVQLGGYFPIFKLFDYRVRGGAIVQLLLDEMGESNVRRNPVMLFNETTIEQPKSCSQPIIFINIDMSLTQIDTAITYMNEDRHVKQKQNISFGNMQPLDKFITELGLYQRPILQINNGMKLDIETLYDHFLEVYPNRINQSTTVKEWMKNIKELMVSWIPNLLDTLTEIAEIGDLFTLSNEHCDNDGGLVSTRHPAYMFFFMITYFYSYKKQLEEVLRNNFQGKNIWYGISFDKNLLDTVFDSTKKLENLFFLRGILQKGDNFRQAKFCVRGEEVLPAIQQKLLDLKLKIKSHFVVAQVSSKHIQLTLHQVVKLALPGEDGASIVVQDKIIYIDDVYGCLCYRLRLLITPLVVGNERG